MSWQAEFWRVLLQQDQDQAEESDARDRDGPDAVTSPTDRRLRAKGALKKLRAKRRRHR